MKGMRYAPSDKGEPKHMAEARKRDIRIDMLKGFAIILVVLGHCVQFVYASKDFGQNIVFRVIYSFHMPLFMFISGYTVALTKKAIDWKWLLKRAAALLIPFATWAVISSIVQAGKNAPAFLLHILLFPENGMWFLLVLFYNCVVLYLAGIVRNRIRSKFRDLSYAATLLTLMLIPGDYFGLNLLKYHFAFYIAGFLWEQYWAKVTPCLRRFLKIGACVLFPFSATMWRWNDKPIFAPLLIGLAGRNSNAMALLNALFLVYRKYFVALLGIGFCFALFRWIGNRIGDVRFLSFIGKYTIEIYVMQFYCWNLVRTPWLLVNTAISFTTALAIPLAIAVIMNRLPLLQWILFGKGQSIQFKRDGARSIQRGV